VTLSMVAMPAPAPARSFEPDPLDVRLYAPTTDTVIVWVDGPIRRADAPLLTLRVRQQCERAVHVILDLSSVTWLDPAVAADLRALEAHADSCGCRLHIAGAENTAIAEPLRRLEPAHQLANGPAAAVLAALAAPAARNAGATPFAGRPSSMENAQ
jgi:anti-anti-sigma regulatory factor